jgi:hypothetical protein
VTKFEQGFFCFIGYSELMMNVLLLLQTALLKALATKQIPGVAWNQRILLLGQTRELSVDEAVGGLRVDEETVLQHVIRSNELRERYTKEASCKF